MPRVSRLALVVLVAVPWAAAEAQSRPETTCKFSQEALDDRLRSLLLTCLALSVAGGAGAVTVPALWRRRAAKRHAVEQAHRISISLKAVYELAVVVIKVSHAAADRGSDGVLDFRKLLLPLTLHKGRLMVICGGDADVIVGANELRQLSKEPHDRLKALAALKHATTRTELSDEARQAVQEASDHLKKSGPGGSMSARPA